MSALEQIVCSTNFSIGGLWATGWVSRCSQVVFQNRFDAPVGVLEKRDGMDARPLENPQLVGCHCHEV